MADKISVRIFGYCHADSAQIATLLAGGRTQDTIHLGGNFVIVGTRGSEVWIVTSPYGVVPYFYSLTQTRFDHGPTVGDVVRSTGQEWQWNFEAVADLLALEHLTADNTLHAGVQRTPACSVLYWDGAKLTKRVSDWAEIHDHYQSMGDPDRLVTLLCEEIERCAGSSNVVSASGGFDSRLMLAALLAAGRKPDLVVSGPPGSTDRSVVEAIARKFGLKVHPIEMPTEDYLSAAEKIAWATSGTKPAGHWHTYVYPARSGFTQNDRFFVGANGEFARSYFLDKGILSYAANCLPPRYALTEFWKRKTKPAFKPGELSGRGKALGEYLSDNGKQIARLVGNEPKSLLHRLDHFYLEERVRHFIGNGLTLYGLSVGWRAPFMSTAWVAEVEKLPRKWKLGSAWHRHAIAKLCDKLLDFPEDYVAPVMARKPAPFYWLPQRRRQAIVAYFDYKKFFADERVLSLLLECAPAIGDLIDPQTVTEIIAEHRLSGSRGRTISILLSLAVWKQQLAQRAH